MLAVNRESSLFSVPGVNRRQMCEGRGDQASWDKGGQKAKNCVLFSFMENERHLGD